MKKLILFIIIIFAVNLFAFDESGYETEFQIGPKINIRGWITQFMIMPTIGTENIKGGLEVSFRGATRLRPTFIYEHPFYFEVADEMYFGVGPIIDLGPSFSFANGNTAISFMDIGLGCKTRFFFNENVGVTFTPVHFSMAFAAWGSGGAGVATGFLMTYDLMFGFIYRWE